MDDVLLTVVGVAIFLFNPLNPIGWYLWWNWMGRMANSKGW